MSRPNWHIPAFPHDHKIVLHKGLVKFGFLWKTDSPDMLVQRDKIDKHGKNRRTVKTSTKEDARKFWNLCVSNGFVRTT